MRRRGVTPLSRDQLIPVGTIFGPTESSACRVRARWAKCVVPGHPSDRCALKILLAPRAVLPDAISRFERESRVVSVFCRLRAMERPLPPRCLRKPGEQIVQDAFFAFPIVSPNGQWLAGYFQRGEKVSAGVVPSRPATRR